MATQNPFADPHLADGLHGGMIPTPLDEYAAAWAYPRPRAVPAGALVNHDLRQYKGQSLFPPVGDQGQIGSCTAWAWGYYLRAALASKWHIDNGTAPDLPDTLAPRFIYDLERQMEGQYPRDSGATMKTGGQILMDVGVPPERDCPYTGQADNGPVDQELTQHMRDAAGYYAVSSYYRLQGQGQALLDSIVACLHANQPCVIAVLVPSSFMRTGKDGRVPSPNLSEQILGGHALCVGLNYYDRSFAGGLCIGGPNQYGQGWGQAGYYFLPASYATTRHPQYGYFLQEAWTAV